MSAAAPATTGAVAAQADGRTSARVPAWAVAVVIGVIAAVALWLRMPAHDRGVLYAEDALEFVGKAVSAGPWQSLFLPYQGYLQFVPRVATGLVTSVLPSALWAYGITVAAAALTGATCALIYVTAADVVTWRPARIALALTPALIPLGAWEVAGTLNNLHSVLLCAVPWILLYRPKSRWGTVLLAVAACAIVLSETQAGLFLPLLLWRLRDPRRWIVRAGYLLGLVAQCVAFVEFPRNIPAHTAIAPTSTVIGFFANGVLGTVLASPARIGALMAHHAVLVYALALPIVVLVAICLIFGTWAERVATLAAGYAAIVVWTVGFNWNLAVNYYPFSQYTPEKWLEYGAILRYAFVPAVFLVALLCLAAAILARRGRLRVVSWVLVIGMTAAMVAGSTAVGPTARTGGPDWRAQVQTASRQCDGSPGSTPKRISGTPYGWWTSIPCARLR